MKYRKLRIAWSVAWGTTMVLLVVLWVRSYWRDDSVNHTTRLETSTSLTARLIGCRSYNGTIRILYEPDALLLSELSPYGWEIDIRPIRLIAGEVLPSIGTFRREQLGDGFAITAPDWVLVAIIAALTGVPWLPWIDWRFSLRTLLIATTLIAALLGLIGWLGR